jgi:hypothetical protein
MKKNKTGASIVWVLAALIAIFTIAKDIKTFDMGTMDSPNVITLRD